MDRKLTDIMVMVPPLDSSRRLMQTQHLPPSSHFQRSRLLPEGNANIQKFEGKASLLGYKPFVSDAPKINYKRIKEIHRNLHIYSKILRPDPQLAPIENKPQPPSFEAVKETQQQPSSLVCQSQLVHVTTLPLLSISHIKLGDVIGQGSEGIVRKGYWPVRGKFVAVKRLTSGRQPSSEVAILQKLQHPNIVSVHGIDQQSSQTHIIMELMVGGSLSSIMREFGSFEERLIRKYTRQLVEALFYLHSLNIVHRDIKCSNILSDVKGNVKLTDFGCARTLGKPHEAEHADEADCCESMIGSFYWMAPELINSKQTSGRKMDVWGLGCAVIEMATNSHPWKECQTFGEFARLVQEQQVPEIPTFLSIECQEFLRSCLQPDPQDRPSIEQVRRLRFVSIF